MTAKMKRTSKPYEAPRGKRPGVIVTNVWGWTDNVWGWTEFEACSHVSMLGWSLTRSLDPDYQHCTRCDLTWRTDDPEGNDLKEACVTCAGKAQRKGQDIERLPLYRLFLCAGCAVALCDEHVFWSEGDEEGAPMCWHCIRAYHNRTLHLDDEKRGA